MPKTRTPVQRYSVYVVDLKPECSPSPSPVGCVYVGETGLAPQERFARHIEGGRTASTVVRRFGVALRDDLSAGVGPFTTRDEAVAAEAKLAAELVEVGFTVIGGQGRTFGLEDQ